MYEQLIYNNIKSELKLQNISISVYTVIIRVLIKNIQVITEKLLVVCTYRITSIQNSNTTNPTAE